ncbi:MAG: 4Fe-4S ferredoxin [Desulfuromonadales bacterium]|nr:4Fe-4S ferredoxin [Desulfuromonadales bacterium]NIR34352.1 4Fe-4S ferredoxin [Desulfuromonadales bacterium]NIS40412.1 4Fe-4S ferredoxin [Desulfuromonadales bacterium]
MIREIVRIDEDKCNGCGDCVPSCAEGAIKIIDGKAKLIADNLCDGLGACLGSCPMDAIIIEKRDADAFDEEAVEEHLAQQSEPNDKPGPDDEKPAPAGGCPSARLRDFSPAAGSGCPSARPVTVDQADCGGNDEAGPRQSQLRQWPIQMHLVPPTAPFLKGADLLLAADCAPFAHADFHKDLLKGRALLIGCPKLDDGQAYLEKLTAMLQQNDIKRLSVVHMEVPCCSGLVAIARQAIAASGKDVPFETVCVGIQGDIK